MGSSPTQQGRVWLIGGTQESAMLARSLVQCQLPCVVTVTTESARSLYPAAATLTVWVGRLERRSLPTFLQHHHIVAVLDASHPFAVEISQLAIAITTERHLPYLRYERPTVETTQAAIYPTYPLPPTPYPPSPTTTSQTAIHPTYPLPPTPYPPASLLHCTSLDSLLTSNLLQGERVLLTLGYRSLALFQPWQGRSTLFARILPSVVALEAALAAGFTPDRLLALRPPISADLERALWQQWQISLVVTKASGTAGGEAIKRQLATELGVKLVVLDRPNLSYPQQTSDRAEALQFCRANVG